MPFVSIQRAFCMKERNTNLHGGAFAEALVIRNKVSCLVGGGIQTFGINIEEPTNQDERSQK
jgi:hypothetical protein